MSCIAKLFLRILLLVDPYPFFELGLRLLRVCIPINPRQREWGLFS
jgi:hypothetical protein